MDRFYPYQPLQFMDGLLDPTIGVQIPTVVFQTLPATITADATNYTFNTVQINCAVGDLVVIVDMNSGVGGGTTSSSMTIAGNAMTQVTKSGTLNCNGAIYQWDATSALTTATVVSNHGSGSSRDSIAVFVLSDLASSTATSSGNTNSASAQTLSIPLNVTSGGIVIGAYQQLNGAGAACTWSAMTGVSEQANINQEATATASVGMGSPIQSYTSQNVTVSCVAAVNNACMVAASWR